jgi:hypothetical protein
MWAADDPLPGPLLALNAMGRRVGLRATGLGRRLGAVGHDDAVVVGTDLVVRDARFTRDGPAPPAPQRRTALDGAS